jgi:hypothetical protein
MLQVENSRLTRELHASNDQLQRVTLARDDVLNQARAVIAEASNELSARAEPESPLAHWIGEQLLAIYRILTPDVTVDLERPQGDDRD